MSNANLQRPSREEYIANRVYNAMAHLTTLTACPDCGHTDHADVFLGRNSDHNPMQCYHIWHCVPTCEGDPWMMAIGLPNRLGTDTGDGLQRTQDMQRRALRYAIMEKL